MLPSGAPPAHTAVTVRPVAPSGRFQSRSRRESTTSGHDRVRKAVRIRKDAAAVRRRVDLDAALDRPGGREPRTHEAPRIELWRPSLLVGVVGEDLKNRVAALEVIDPEAPRIGGLVDGADVHEAQRTVEPLGGREVVNGHRDMVETWALGHTQRAFRRDPSRIGDGVILQVTPSTSSRSVPSGSKKKVIRTPPSAFSGSRWKGTPPALRTAANGSTLATLNPMWRKPRCRSSASQVDGCASSIRLSSTVADTTSSTA